MMSLQTKADGETGTEIKFEEKRVDIPYITKADTVSVRPLHVYTPEGARKPTPVVYISHYEMKKDSKELLTYLSEGWAVVSPADVTGKHSMALAEDNLVFNNAALYAVRHCPDFDPQRIAVTGGSAGGYMSMMLNALQMGACVHVAMSPVENLYFNFKIHFHAAQKINNESNSEKVPIPYINMVYKCFAPVEDLSSDDAEGIRRWEALSPVGLAQCYSSPFLVTHRTSDMLVPVDQTTRRFTYRKNGDSVPQGFSTRMSRSLPGKLGRSLDEELPAKLKCVTKYPIVPKGSVAAVAFDPSKPFNISIMDDGPVEGYSSHTSDLSGKDDILPYLEEMLSRSLAQNEMLRPEKLRLLLERYLGRSIQLPAHENIDDTVYGSLSIYRQEVIDELGTYVKNHSVRQVDKMVASLKDPDLQSAWNEIKVQIFTGFIETI